MFSIRCNRWTIAAFAFTALVVPASLSAQTPDHPADNSAQFPTSHDLKSLTMSGSYLAARHASVERDAASAAEFYRSALRTDPKNSELLDRAFISSLADGDIDEAVKLADRILTIDKSNRVARLVVGVRDLKLKKYASAQLNINQSIRGPITDLVATLLSGWASYGAGDAKAAVANIDKLTGPEWYPIFKDLHSGMIVELAGKEKDAGVRLERAYKLDDSMLRVADDYARWLTRNKDEAAATAVYEAFDKKLPRHPLVLEGLREARAGKKLPPLVDSPQAGAAEALYGIGATLTRRGGEDLALVYLQLALYLEPNHPLALLSLADLYESVKKPAMAIKVYERMPASSPLKRNAQIQLATDLDAADRSDEAIKILKSVTAEDPKDLEAITNEGNPAAVLRSAALDARALTAFDERIVDIIINAIFGVDPSLDNVYAPGEPAPEAEPRERTDLESRLVGEFTKALATALQDAFAPVASFDLAFESLDKISDLNRLGPSDMPTCRPNARSRRARAFRLLVVLPQMLSTPLADMFARGPDPGAAKSIRNGRASWSKA